MPTLPRLAVLTFLAAAFACSSGPEPPIHVSPPPLDSGLRYVIYYNSDATPLAAVAEAGYTHVIVSFVRAYVTEDGAVALIAPPKMEGQWEAVETVRAAGTRVMISFGGGEVGTKEYAPLVGREEDLATALATFVKEHDLDGVDIDFEASEMFHLKRPDGVPDGRGFLIALAGHLRDKLPAPRYELSHTPQPPYMNHTWHGGPYLDVLEASPHAIDWISVQYYNNPDFDTPVADKIVGKDHHSFASSYHALVNPLGRLRWPSNRILVGKPVYTKDASTGYLTPAQVRSEIIEPLCAAFGNDFGGLVGWEFSDGTDDHRDWNTTMAEALSAARCVDATSR